MHVVTVIAKPGKLDPALVESLRNAWGGGDAVWLAPDEAAEFSLEQRPDNLWDVWSDVQKFNVDLVLQPVEGRRKKVLIAGYGQHNDPARMYRRTCRSCGRR